MKTRFDTQQKVCSIGGRTVGGQPGENPPLMIGNMFWPGDKVVQSRKEGKFDRERATAQIRRLEQFEKTTGLPSLVDMVANTGEEIKRYIDFFVEITEESGMPFASDAYMTRVKQPAAEHVAGLGQMDRYLYNSLSFWEKELEKEIETISALGVKHVVVGLWDAQDDFSTGRLKCRDKMWSLLEQAGFETILCDCSVMSLPTAMICNNAMELVKAKYGLPSGSGPANGVYMWMKDAEKLGGKEAFKGVDAGVNAITSMGADWQMYGPVEACDRVFPSVAIAQCNIAALIMDERKTLPDNPTHPFHILFPDIVQEFHEKLAGWGGPANGVYMWMKDAEKLGGKEAFKGVDAGVNAITSMGADWQMYGPVEACDRVFPSVAIAQCNIAALIMDERKTLPDNPTHPFHILFPDIVKEFHEKLAGVEKKRKWLKG